MSTIVIFYKGANQHSVSAGPTDRIVLNPGQNVVDEEMWNKIVSMSEKEMKANKGRATGVCRLLEEELVKVFGEGEESGVDFEKLNQKDADKNREKVLAAIDKQIDKLKKADS